MTVKKSKDSNSSNTGKSTAKTRKTAGSISMGNGKLTFRQIQDIAKSKGINPVKMKKVDIIKTIQRTEGNFDCFGTATAGFCDQHGCLWITECLNLK